jgi:FHIPEP family
MPGSEVSIPSVKVAVEFPAAWSSALGDGAIQKLSQAAESYAEGIAKDLHLGTVQFVLKDAPGQNSAFSVTINGQKCRLPFRCVTELSSLTDPAESARRIARIIHENRKLLVSAEIALALREGWSSENQGLFLPELSRVEFLEYLGLLVQGCFRVRGNKELKAPLPHARRSRGFDHGKRPWPETPEEYYELSVGSLANLRCILYRSPNPGESATLEARSIMQKLDEMRERFFLDLGVRLPVVRLGEDATLAEREFRLRINDLRLPTKRGLGRSEFLVDMDPRRLRSLGLAGQLAQNPVTGAPAAILGDPEAANQAKAKGLTVVDRERYIVEACDHELRRHAGAFVVAEGLQHELDLLRPRYFHIVSATETRFGEPVIAHVLRNLVTEGVSMRDLPGVLEAMLSLKEAEHIGGDGKEKAIEAVRDRLKDSIAYNSARGYKTLPIYRIAEDIDKTLRKGSVTEEERLAIGKAIWESIRRATLSPIVIVTGLAVRRMLKELIEIELPEVVVLSDQEIGDIRVQTLGHISQSRADESRKSST